MLGLHLKFKDFARIGFAHHFHTDNYRQVYGSCYDYNGFELVYVKTGGVTARIYDKEYQIEPHSVVVLERSLPFELFSADGAPQTHCTVQVMMNYDVELIDSNASVDLSRDGIMVPFITPPCNENETIKKELYSIISNFAGDSERNSLSASLSVFSILSKLDSIYRQRLFSKKNTASLLEYKIKRYISEHMDKEIPLCDISAAIGKTPNYLNSVFKSATGMGIHQYINREKVCMICELMEYANLSFKEACENVAIYDVSYGYRLFKKQTGVTPKEYLAGERCKQ